MKLQDARTLSPDDLLDRRKQAILLFQQGKNRVEIAPLVGVHRNTVGEWIRDWQGGGLRALKPKPSGRPRGSGRRLTPPQEREIQACLVDKMPDQLKLPFALWTRDAVRLLIREKTGQNLPIRTVGEYLRRWGFTPQKPVKRAYERCEASVKRWLDTEYPAIAAEARRDGSEIHWGDETGLRSDDARGRGYAPKGQTPVRRTKGTPEKLNMISTVTNQGKVRFRFYSGALNAALFIDFMKRLVRDNPSRGRVVLIVDRHPVHRSYKVRDWLQEHPEEIVMFFLPSYSPDLNPDEHLNGHLKDGVGRRPDARKKGRLKQTALSVMRSIQKQPERVRQYFEADAIRYAA